MGLGVTFLVVGGLAALDFDRAFALFHALFFPGKTNWLFDWRTDPIILFMPEEFFRNCALLILILLLLWCGVLIAADLAAGRYRRVHGGDRGTKSVGKTRCQACFPLTTDTKDSKK